MHTPSELSELPCPVRKLCGSDTGKGGRAETAGAGAVIGEGAESGQQQTGRRFIGIKKRSDVTERKKSAAEPYGTATS